MSRLVVAPTREGQIPAFVDPFDVDATTGYLAETVLVLRSGQRIPVGLTPSEAAAWVNEEREKQQPPIGRTVVAERAPFPHPTRELAPR